MIHEPGLTGLISPLSIGEWIPLNVEGLSREPADVSSFSAVSSLRRGKA